MGTWLIRGSRLVAPVEPSPCDCRASGFAVSVAAQGLAPGTRHSIHLHVGSCGAAVAGTHLVILGTIAANGMGSGEIATRVGLHYSIGRYVIVHANLSPATVIGCADLGSIQVGTEEVGSGAAAVLHAPVGADARIASENGWL